MALSLSMDTSSIGVPFPEAYARVGNVLGDKTCLTVMVFVYASQEARASESQPVSTEVWRIDVPDLSGDLFPAIYGWLKANVPHYADASDV